MGHNVGDAAARAVERSEKKGGIKTYTPEESIKLVRGNLAAQPLMHTPAHHIAALLGEFDAREEKITTLRGIIATLEATVKELQDWNKELKAEVKSLATTSAEAVVTIDKLREENEQFRHVYEVENSSRGTVRVEAGDFPEGATEMPPAIIEDSVPTDV